MVRLTHDGQAAAPSEAAREEVDIAMAAALTSVYRASGRTQSAIAKAMGENEKQLQRYLKGETVPKLSWIARFAEAANSSVQIVLGEAGLLPKLDVSQVIDQDPAIHKLYRNIVRDHYEAAVRHSQPLLQERVRRTR